MFEKALEGIFIDRMDQNEELFGRFMGDADFQRLVAKTLLKDVYDRIRKAGGSAPSIPAVAP